MKAAQINHYMPVADVRLTQDAAKPQVASGHVLIEVHAAALNPIDWKVVEGELKQFMQLPMPFIPGSDVAGVVAEVGKGVDGFRPGDEVYGMVGFNRKGSGSLAEFALADAAAIWEKPANLDFETAAAVPMTGLRAWIVLVKFLQVQPGQKILIHGGAGGIGSFAIQIAKHLGATVATTVSTKDMEFAKELGTDVVIDYTKEDFSKQLSDYDAVFDVVGADTFAKSFEVLKPGGKITTMLWGRRPDLAAKHQVQVVEQGDSATPEAFAELGKLIEQGIVKVHVDKVFPFDQAGSALDYQKHGHPQGKVVVKIQDNHG